jgi:transcriptional regulator with XRE-family HTH domain
MSLRQPSAFGILLKQDRLATGLSQAVLAEQAGVSVDAISMLESGTRQAPHPETIRLLAKALRLSEQQHAALTDAAAQQRRRGPRVAPSVPLAALFPPTQALPVPLVSPIGREREFDAVTALLRGGARLLILTGPGGAGKTLLALHAAHAARDAFPDGVAYLPLAALPDPTALAATIARLLGVRDRGGQALPDTAIDDLQGKRRLLVLDNYELIAAAAPLLVDLCAACPDLTILVISRVALHVRGAPEVAVPPCPCPTPTLRVCPPSRISSNPWPCDSSSSARGTPGRVSRSRRRTRARSPKSASGSTGCRWPSNWPRRTSSYARSLSYWRG